MEISSEELWKSQKPIRLDVVSGGGSGGSGYHATGGLVVSTWEYPGTNPNASTVTQFLERAGWYPAKGINRIQEDKEVNSKVEEQREITEAVTAEVRKRRVDREVAERLAKIAEYGEDNYPNETVVFFRKKFQGKDQSFSYAAIKANDYWYVTGVRMNGSALSWDDFVLTLVTDIPATDFKVLG